MDKALDFYPLEDYSRLSTFNNLLSQGDPIDPVMKDSSRQLLGA
jgi:hypothetical protein